MTSPEEVKQGLRKMRLDRHDAGFSENMASINAALDLLAHYEQRIKELEAKVPRWIPCSERMPEDGQDCLVLLCWDDQQPYVTTDTWRMGTEAPLSFSSATIETGLEWSEYDYDEISQWMPLPSPPTETTDSTGGSDEGR